MPNQCRYDSLQHLLLQLKKLIVDIGSLAEGYKTAGQFVQIKVGDSKPGFFAIASAPDSNNQGLIEVLIKDGPPDSAANLLCSSSPGPHSCLPFLAFSISHRCLYLLLAEHESSESTAAAAAACGIPSVVCF